MKEAPFSYVKFFASRESQVRSYCRRMPALLKSAKGARMWDAGGVEYVSVGGVRRLELRS